MNHRYPNMLRAARHAPADASRPRRRRRRAAATWTALLVLLALVASASAAGAASITGTVTAEGVPVQSVTVNVFEASGSHSPLKSAETDAAGNYEVAGLLEKEKYKLEFVPTGTTFAFQFYAKKPSLAEAETFELEGPTGTANEELVQAALISGAVTDAVTHEPVAGVSVTASTAGEPTPPAGTAVTDAGGNYTISSLPAATYNVHFEGGAPHLDGEVAGVGATAGTTEKIDAALTPAAPHNTAAPTVGGTAALGQTVTCLTGTWTGRQPITYTYQWRRDGGAIEGATGSLYTIQAVDQGHGVSCDVVASNEAGSAGPVRSAAVAVAPATVIVITPAPVPVPPALVPPPARAPTARIAVSAAKLIFVRRVAKAKLACTVAPCTGTLKLTEPVIVTRLRGNKVISRTRKTLVLATGSFSLAAGRQAAVLLRLTSVGRGRLAATRSQRLPALLSTSLRGAAPFAQRVIFTATAPPKPRKHK